AGACTLRCKQRDVRPRSRATTTDRSIEGRRADDYSGRRFRRSGALTSPKEEWRIAAARCFTGPLWPNGGRSDEKIDTGGTPSVASDEFHGRDGARPSKSPLT